jgi:glucokinase
MENIVIGIDIGGSHISVCMVDTGKAEWLDHSFVRVKVDPHGSARNIIETWAAAIASCMKQVPLSHYRIGIAMPGPFDYAKGISLITGLHKFESLYGLNVKQLLAQQLGIPVEHIRMVNDASAFLLGEVMCGAGKGHSRAAGVTLGTGLGSAGFFEDAIRDGDLWCTDFKSARAEDYLCSRWFVQEYEALGRADSKTINGVKDLAPLFHTDPEVRSLFTTFGRHLAEVLLMKYPPAIQDVIIVGGNITKAWDLFIPATLDWCREQGVELNIRPALLGENAAVAGAAFLWK